jgi:hypothetical protein
MTATGTVELAAAVSAGGDEAGETQLGQVLTRRCGRSTDETGERADVVLVLAQEPHQTETGGIGEKGKRCGRPVKLGWAGQLADGIPSRGDICSYTHMSILFRG